MTAQEIITIEDYKKRISDLIDEVEQTIGCKIQSVNISQKRGSMLIRGVKFNIEL
jgi:adenylosuccinate synthase